MAKETTTFTFTKYCFDSYKRFIKITLAELRQQTLAELESHEMTCYGIATFRQHIVNGFVLNVNLDVEYDDDEDEDNETVCSITANFDLFTGVNKGRVVGRALGICEDDRWTDYPDVQERLTKTLESYIGVEFKKCKQSFCDNIQVLDTDTEGWCKTCYISSYHREEKCPVCLEDDGYWMTLNPCGHVIHGACWQKVVANICPLCRAECAYSKKSEF